MDWPNGISARHHASPVDGYDLCYSARPGDPVTLFTARQGLRVQMADVDDYHGSGVLLKPVAVSADGVVWSVDFPHLYKGFPQKYLMETSTSRRISDAKDYKTVKTELRVSACEGTDIPYRADARAYLRPYSCTVPGRKALPPSKGLIVLLLQKGR